MGWRSITMHRLQELVRLHRMGHGSREVARLLRMSPNTERQYRRALEAQGLLEGSPEELPELATLKTAVRAALPQKKRRQEVSSVAPWAAEIEKMVERDAGPRAIFDRLRLEHDDFSGSLSAVKRFCLSHKRRQGVQAADVAIPVETAPGEVAQVDFGYAGQLYDPDAGRLRKAWVFVMVLGYSRHMVAYFVFDQKTETWLDLHVRAFEELGGVPETIVPDNLKAAVIRAAFGIDSETGLNRSYRELARHYGFKIDPTPVRDPKKKGKVESGVKYVKRNFIRPRDLSECDIRQAQAQLDQWLVEIAGKRTHGTTGRRPAEVFASEEASALEPLPAAAFERVLWKKAKVHRDSHVVFEKRLYSVPWRLIGEHVWVRATRASVCLYFDDERVATHSRRGPSYRSTNDAHLPDHRVRLRHRSRSYWVERAARMGRDVVTYINEVFDADDVLSQLRTVQAIVSHLEKFPVERARAACRRARFYGAHKYGAVRDILRKGLDLEPLPTAVIPAHGRLRKPRFARTATDLFNQVTEVNDEYN